MVALLTPFDSFLFECYPYHTKKCVDKLARASYNIPTMDGSDFPHQENIRRFADKAPCCATKQNALNARVVASEATLRTLAHNRDKKAS